MSERTRQMVWEQIKASELVGSEEVPLSIDTVKLLLKCARFVNEVAATQSLDFHLKYNVSFPRTYILDENEVRDRAEELSRLL